MTGRPRVYWQPSTICIKESSQRTLAGIKSQRTLLAGIKSKGTLTVGEKLGLSITIR